MASSYTVISPAPGGKQTSYGFLKTAKAKAQALANEYRVSVQIYPNGKGKVRHVYPKKQAVNPRQAATILPRGRFVKVRIRVKGKVHPAMARVNPKTGRVQVKVSPQIANKLPGRRKNPDRYGTSYFVSKSAAVRYYRPYMATTNVKEAVERKISEGEIHIGRPPLKAGQHLFLLDGGKRYGIEES